MKKIFTLFAIIIVIIIAFYYFWPREISTAPPPPPVSNNNNMKVEIIKNTNTQDAEATPSATPTIPPPHEDKNHIIYLLNQQQSKNKKVEIKSLKTFQQLIKNKPTLVEKLKITTTSENGSVKSFHALIDSATGMVIETFDFTIEENFDKSKIKTYAP